MPKRTLQQSLPTVIGFGARRAIDVLRERKVAIAPVLRRVGLTERDLDKPQRRIPAAAQAQILEYASEALGDSSFGLHLAKRTNPREAGLLFYVASAAKTLGEALMLFERYFRIVNEAVHLTSTRTGEGVIVEVCFRGLSRPSIRQNAEFGIALIVKAGREISGRTVRLSHVAFAHARNSNLREFERFYGCPVEFGASSDRIAVSEETLELPLVTEDWYLLETLRPVCEAAARERATPKETLRAEVENEAQKLLPYGKARKETVAKAFGLSTRTLSRRLSDEGTSFEEVLDQLRRSLALRYVTEPGISLSQIAWLLGYEEATSFNHAFKRWTGRSPSNARNERGLPEPA